MYDYAMATGKLRRRSVLKGAAGAVVAGVGAGLSGAVTHAFAQSALRQEILKIPGVGVGSPN